MTEDGTNNYEAVLVELSTYIDHFQKQTEELEEKQKVNDWKTWINIVQNRDCIAALKFIPDSSIDCIITDAPYGIEYFSNDYKDGNPFKPIANDDKLFIPMEEFWRILKDTGSMFLFYSQKVPLWDERVKNTIIWVKDSGTMGDLEGDFQNFYELIAFIPKSNFKLKTKRYSNVWYFDKVHPDQLVHPTQKPEKLINRIIECATVENDLVLDAFLGSGTTAVCCKLMNRRFIGFELEGSYCEIANRRLSQVSLSSHANNWKPAGTFKQPQKQLNSFNVSESSNKTSPSDSDLSLRRSNKMEVKNVSN